MHDYTSHPHWPFTTQPAAAEAACDEEIREMDPVAFPHRACIDCGKRLPERCPDCETNLKDKCGS